MHSQGHREFPLAERALRECEVRYRTLAARLEAVREEERARIAREIHDQLAQDLTRLKFDLVRLQRQLAHPGAAADGAGVQELVGGMIALTNTAITSVKRIATELRPVVLDSLGLPAALEWQAQEFETRTGIACRVQVPAIEHPLDRDLATGLFRILQESLINAARHAQATRVSIRLAWQPASPTHRLAAALGPGAWVLTVQDNGIGIKPAQVRDPRALGLLGIRERTLLLGGQCEIIGQPGKGTTVEVRVPVPPPFAPHA